MQKPPFHFVPITPERSLRKPRANGRTMIVDDGMPLAYTRDLVALGGAYIDLAKIKTGTARLYPRARLVEKLRDHRFLSAHVILDGHILTDRDIRERGRFSTAELHHCFVHSGVMNRALSLFG